MLRIGRAPAIGKINTRTYRRRRVVEGYVQLAGLTTPEKYCMGLIPPARRVSVLDIGVGGGRTTGPLSEIFTEYTGIDCSPEMVTLAQRRFPGKKIFLKDAREIEFDRPFDCVMFSYNGIDAVTYEDRLSIMSKISRIVSPGGYFIYSTHNLNCRNARSYFSKFFEKSLFRTWRSPIFGMPNRIRNYWRQRIDDAKGFGYINDNPHAFGLLNLYVDIPREIQFLRENGLSVQATFGAEKNTAVYDENDEFVYLAAQKL